MKTSLSITFDDKAGFLEKCRNYIAKQESNEATFSRFTVVSPESLAKVKAYLQEAYGSRKRFTLQLADSGKIIAAIEEIQVTSVETDLLFIELFCAETGFQVNTLVCRREYLQNERFSGLPRLY